MRNSFKVIFIICTYNRARYLDETIKSLLEPDLSNLDFELLIIDNNSKDQTPDVVQKYQKEQSYPIMYVKEKKQGLSYARNRGIKEASAPYLVFLDDDINATKSLIPEWISFFQSHPEAIAAGGKIHVQFDDPRPNWMPHFLLPLLGYHDLGNTLKKYPGNKYPFGGNMGFRKSIFEEVGYFDENLGRKGTSLNAGEEKELFRRIRSKSYDIYYLPDAFLYHRVNKQRLTEDYIKKQAQGLGQSMKLRMKKASVAQKIRNWLSEGTKFLSSLLLGLGYLMCLNPQKAIMLFKFRWWIWKEYFGIH